jgi:3-deoxy-D-manno-octulosonic-acid transferase
LALFVKYEFWFHYLDTLNRNHIPVVLFSAVFQTQQIFFKPYGSWYRKMLQYYDIIFVQDIASKNLLSSYKINNVAVAGDTRFDRVWALTQQTRQYNKVSTFVQGKKLLIAGSTWEGDEVLLKEALSQLNGDYKLLLVPHETNANNIHRILKLFDDKAVIWDVADDVLLQHTVAIVNTIGQLAYLYRYADVVWIGGGFTRSGIHNSIEAAVYGKPLFWGPNYRKYLEAVQLINGGAAMAVENGAALAQHLIQPNNLLNMGLKAQSIVAAHRGATTIIMRYLSEKYFPNKA